MHVIESHSYCERSELRLHFEWTIVYQKCQKWSILESFWKPEACSQTVLPARSVLIGQKLVENAKIQKFKCDILSNFQTMWVGWATFDATVISIENVQSLFVLLSWFLVTCVLHFKNPCFFFREKFRKVRRWSALEFLVKIEPP